MKKLQYTLLGGASLLLTSGCPPAETPISHERDYSKTCPDAHCERTLEIIFDEECCSKLLIEVAPGLWGWNPGKDEHGRDIVPEEVRDNCAIPAPVDCYEGITCVFPVWEGDVALDDCPCEPVHISEGEDPHQEACDVLESCCPDASELDLFEDGTVAQWNAAQAAAGAVTGPLGPECDFEPNSPFGVNTDTFTTGAEDCDSVAPCDEPVPQGDGGPPQGEILVLEIDELHSSIAYQEPGQALQTFGVDGVLYLDESTSTIVEGYVTTGGFTFEGKSHESPALWVTTPIPYTNNAGTFAVASGTEEDVAAVLVYEGVTVETNLERPGSASGSINPTTGSWTLSHSSSGLGYMLTITLEGSSYGVSQ